MFRQSWLPIVCLILLSIPLGAIAQSNPLPPPGFYTALGDVNRQIGQNISLNCSDPNDGSTCAMSDTRLDWEWAFTEFPNGALGCPAPDGIYTQAFESAYQYTFEWQGQIFDYRQRLNDAVLICTANGLQPLGNAPALPPTVTPPPSGISCPDAVVPRLQVGGLGQITPGPPNNIRVLPDSNSASVGQIPGGEIFRVVSGPVCAGTVLYWEVEYNGIVGWTGEGSRGTYWATPVQSPTVTPTAPAISADLTIPNVTTPIRADNAAQLAVLAGGRGTLPMIWMGDGSLILNMPEGESGQLMRYPVGDPTPTEVVTGSVFVEAVARQALPQVVALEVPLTEANPTPIFRVINLQNNLSLTVNDYQSQFPRALSLSADGNQMAFAVTSDGQGVVVYNLLTAQEITRLPHDVMVTSTAFQPDGNILATAEGQRVVLWDLVTRNRIATLDTEFNATGSRPVFSPDGSLLAVPSQGFAFGDAAESYVAIYDMATREVAKNIALPAPIGSLDFSPDGRLLAIGSGAQIFLFDMQTDQMLAQTPLRPDATTLSRGWFNQAGTLLAVLHPAAESDVLGEIEIYGARP